MLPWVRREWAFAIIEAGLPEDLFWRSTPRELATLYERWGEREKRHLDIQNRQTARICALLANINRDKKQKPTPFTEEDFMPRLTGETQDNKPQEWGDQMAILSLAGIREVDHGR